MNVANITTPGFKRRVAFSSLLAAGGSTSTVASTVDFTAGKLNETGNSFDLAIVGEGFFAVRTGDRVAYTREGQFHRDPDGRLVNAHGYVLQAGDGADLVLKGGALTVAADGTVSENGAPVARIGVFDVADRRALTPGESGQFTVADGNAAPAQAPTIRQGALEASNVSVGDEMVALMQALRRAESGQRVAGVYDDLMGRVITAFGQN